MDFSTEGMVFNHQMNLPSTLRGAAGLVLVVAACTGTPTASPNPTPAAPTVESGDADSTTDAASTLDVPDDAVDLDCSTVIDSSSTLDPYWDDILGAVGLPTPNSADEALFARRESLDRELPWSAKIGLLVRANTMVLIAVDEPQDSTAILWGNATRELFSPALWTEGCPGEGWLAFPGGFRVDKPHCVALTVTTLRAARMSK